MAQWTHRANTASCLFRRRWPAVTCVAITASVLGCNVATVLRPEQNARASEDDEDARERRYRYRRGKKRRLRDWHVEMPSSVARQLDQAITYFSNSIRVPAALIAGQAGNMLTRLTELPTAHRAATTGRAGVAPKWSLRERIYVTLFRVHLVLISYTVVAELTAMLLSSTAHSQILDIGRDELSLEPTALDLIMRHVEFEYLAVRVFFISGIAAFLLAVFVRILATLGAGPQGSTITGKRELVLCAALCGMLVSTLAIWGHIYNDEMENFQGVWHLLRRFTVLVIRKAFTCPLVVLSILTALMSALLALIAIFGWTVA
eukprot:TRINITY_DN17897_c0_g1_i1.p1 TRINITY_DN17897_c0_g1~~TRINITY_DN17897_c0_g1_i1.p1  ORF type:complete len:318 (-),score=40.72 TRINITY_DN17897_c0_g1_i1:95-1048(-)